MLKIKLTFLFLFFCITKCFIFIKETKIERENIYLKVRKNISKSRLIRRNLVIFACEQGVKECVSKAKNYFEKWMSTEDITE